MAAPFSPRLDAAHGGRVIGQMLRHLTDRNAVALVYLQHPGQGPVDAEVASRCDLVEAVALRAHTTDNAWRRRLLVLGAPLTGRPTHVEHAYSPQFAQAIRRVADHWHPDVIQIEHDGLAYVAPFIADRARARVLVAHDPGLTLALHMMRQTRGRRWLAHALESRVWRRYWRAHLPLFGATVVFNDADAQTIRDAVPGLRVATIPLGIEVPPEALDPVGSADSVIFVGGYQHLPNADAALRLMTSIAPAVRSAHPALRLLLVGDQPTEPMRAAASAADELSGRVPDVTPYLNAAAVVALPIRVGGGMRVKLLEALAAGKAIVASPLAAAGLDVTDGEQLLIATSDAEFAAAIIRLLDDIALRVRLGGAARAWTERNLSWSTRVERYEELYRELLR